MATHNIMDYGARGDARTNDAAAIQRAIDNCAAEGGGMVLIPSGRTFRSGAIALRSSVELHLERGATLLASDSPADYPRSLESDVISAGVINESELPKRALIIAYRADNVAITGGGTIDGNGRAFVAEDLGHIYRMAGDRQYLERPFTIFLIGCTPVTIRDVTIRDAAFWTIRAAGCDDVLIHGVRILNDLKLPNNDGIDIDCCCNVRISDCHIVSGDDAICLKACRAIVEAGYTACENVTVTGCTLVSTSSALKIGNEVMAPIRDVVFDACVIRRSHRGLSVHSGQRGDVENILFSNMIVETRIFHNAWWGRGEPIFVAATPWDDEVGHVRRVRFSNILCRSENGVCVQSWRPALVSDLLFENVRVEISKTSKWPGGQHDLRPCSDAGLYEHRTSGFFINQADDVTLRNCEVIWGERRPDYFCHALETHDVINFVAENFRGTSAHPTRYAAMLND